MAVTNVDVAIDPSTGNPVMRTTPEHKLKRVYANGVNVVVVGEIGGQETSSVIPRAEAISRARAINEMATKAKYSDEHDHLVAMVEQFIEAIQKAKENEGGQYTGISIGMYNINKQQQAMLKS